MRAAAGALLLLAPLFAAAAAAAGREPVLSQVALPHGYYWRELYIPQLTTGPSSVAFMPSGDLPSSRVAGMSAAPATIST